MKNSKKILASILGLCILLCGCGQSETSSESPEQVEPTAVMKTALLYTNIYTGSDIDDFQTHPFEYTGDLTVEKLAQGLSELTGLDFFITETPSSEPNEITIDWALDSTLIANMDGREQKEEFFLYDTDSMSWFMMDSLWRTVMENFEVKNIYYTMDGGQELILDEKELSGTNEFPSDIPYMGSSFYYVQDYVKDGEVISEDEAFALVENTLMEQGEEALVIVRTGDDIIEGEPAFIFSSGAYSEDGQKFTAMYHYAVSYSGIVYFMDPMQGADWVSFYSDM